MDRSEPIDETAHHPPYHTAAPGDTLGLKHVREALADLPFPLRTSELRARAGTWRMPVTGTRFETLDLWLDGVREKKFYSPNEVAAAIGRAHHELRE